MANYLKHPNLILGLISFATLLIAVGLRANRYNAISDAVLAGTFVIGLIHWIWSIIDVLHYYRTNTAGENRTIVWVIIVLIVPPVGGILYYAFNKNLVV